MNIKLKQQEIAIAIKDYVLKKLNIDINATDVVFNDADGDELVDITGEVIVEDL